MGNLQEKIEKLKKDADEIQNLAEVLIKSAPVSMSRRIDMYVFGILPNDLSEVQTKLRIKYLAWYNSVYPLVEKFLPHQLIEFQSKYNKTGGFFSTSISDIINLKTGYRPHEGRSKVIQDFSECFSFQIGQLLSIQLEEEPILEGRKVMNDISLDNLEKVLTQTIYDYILKNPTIFHTKSRSIIPQRKKEVKERDNFICQICNENFNEDELEVDHVYPHSLGGSNRIENLMALCINCNRDKGKRLDYYRSGEGRKKLMENIKYFTRNLPMISNFGEWLRKTGGTKKSA